MLLLSAFSIATYAQQEGADSTRLWTIKGENTFLINQSSFSNWAAGGVNSFAGNLMELGQQSISCLRTDFSERNRLEKE